MRTNKEDADICPDLSPRKAFICCIVMPDLQPYEAAAEVEINFFIGKLKYIVKRRKDAGQTDTVE